MTNRRPLITDNYGITPEPVEEEEPARPERPWWETLGQLALRAGSYPGGPGMFLQGFEAAPPPPPPPAPLTPPPPPLDFGGGASEADQAIIDSLTAFQEQLGNMGELPPITPLPEPPLVTADPSAAYMREYMGGRSADAQALLEQYRAELNRDDPTNDHWMNRLGEFISALAADGNIANAGAIMMELNNRDRDASREMRQRDIELQLRAMGFEDDAAAAMAAAMSAEHGAEASNADRRYTRDVNNIERQDAFNRDSAQASRAAAEAQLRLQMMLAEAQAAAQERAREAVIGRASPFLTDPVYGAEAAEAIAGAQGIDDPMARERAAGLQLEASGGAQGLRLQIAEQMADLNDFRRDDDAVAAMTAYLQQWNPAITENDVQELTPDQLWRRALTGSTATQAFRNNPGLSRYAAGVGE